MPRADRQPSTALRLAAIVSVSALFTGSVPICRAADPQPDRAARVPTGEFKIGKDGRLVLLPVTLGSRTISCLLDTGACLSAFDVTLAELLGQPRGMRNLQTADRLIQVQTFDWPDARLDGQVFKGDQPAACLDLRHIREATNERVLGVIGIDLLRAVRFQIDFDEGTLRLLPSLPEAPGELGVKIPVRFLRDGPPVIAGSPGTHRRRDFVIDTGAQGNSLEAALFDGLVNDGQIRIGASFSSVTATGAFRGQRGRLEGL